MVTSSFHKAHSTHNDSGMSGNLARPHFERRPRLLMTVTMMQVGQVRMVMRQRFMAMLMGMRLGTFIARMSMLMMLVVHMHVLVLQSFVRMHVFMALGEHQPWTAQSVSPRSSAIT